MVFVYKKLAQFAVRCALPPRRSESPVCATDNKPSCVLHLLGWFIGSHGFSSLERRPEFWVLTDRGNRIVRETLGTTWQRQSQFGPPHLTHVKRNIILFWSVCVIPVTFFYSSLPIPLDYSPSFNKLLKPEVFAKDCLYRQSEGSSYWSPEVRKEVWEGLSCRASRRYQPCQHFDFRLLASRTGKTLISVVLSHSVCVYLLQQLQETNTKG